jgi:molybdenum cofactor guanylyltransferase
MTSPEGKITAVVLAGGKNIRFKGVDKAFVRVHGVPMIERILNTLDGIFEDIIVVTNSSGKYQSMGNLGFASDIYKNAGPLGGIHAAMKKSETPFIFVFSCDMPYLDRDIIKGQITFFRKLQNADALIPRLNSNIEPLHAIYRSALAGSLAEFLDSSPDYSIRAFLEKTRVAYYYLPCTSREIKAFSNINTAADIPGPDISSPRP